jgi:hypothetical protein
VRRELHSPAVGILPDVGSGHTAMSRGTGRAGTSLPTKHSTLSVGTGGADSRPGLLCDRDCALGQAETYGQLPVADIDCLRSECNGSRGFNSSLSAPRIQMTRGTLVAVFNLSHELLRRYFGGETVHR